MSARPLRLSDIGRTIRGSRRSLARLNAATKMTLGLMPSNRKRMLLSLRMVGMLDDEETEILIGQLGLQGE